MNDEQLIQLVYDIAIQDKGPTPQQVLKLCIALGIKYPPIPVTHIAETVCEALGETA
jgi:hypothetical protein